MDRLTLPDAPWRQRARLGDLVAALGHGAARFVGGAVRDTLIGLPVSDVDLATIHPPEEVVRRLRAADIQSVPTGIRHGTITAVLPDGPVEVTTLRRDVATDGRHATVVFSDDWHEDAARRDFTINALYADPADGTVFDSVGGIADLERRLVRFIGDPLQRIAEDHLRILRFFRFHARFGGVEMDAPALEACTARANDLMALSRERIADELTKLLVAARAPEVLSGMVKRGVLAPVLPEIDYEGVVRLQRVAAREDALAMPADADRRFAALLPADPALARDVGARLRLSNARRRRLVAAAGALEAGDPRASAYRIGMPALLDRALRDADDSRMAEVLAALDGWSPPKLPITGGALVALGVTTGPEVAHLLRVVERQWVSEGFPDRKRIEAIAREVVEGR